MSVRTRFRDFRDTAATHLLSGTWGPGTYYWGRWSAKRRKWRSEADWLKLEVQPIVEPSLYELAMKLRAGREPRRNPGRPALKANLLAGRVYCGSCSASCQLETSGKRVKGDRYEYRYYNCRKFCRIGRSACPGCRIRTNELDEIVLGHLADAICAATRCDDLRARLQRKDGSDLRGKWRALINAGGTVSRNYLLHLIERIEVRENEIRIVPHEESAALT